LTRGELDKAEEFYLHSLEIDKALGRKEGMASDYGNLSIIYAKRGDLVSAEKFCLQSLELFKEMGAENSQNAQIFRRLLVHLKARQSYETSFSQPPPQPNVTVLFSVKNYKGFETAEGVLCGSESVLGNYEFQHE